MPTPNSKTNGHGRFGGGLKSKPSPIVPTNEEPKMATVEAPQPAAVAKPPQAAPAVVESKPTPTLEPTPSVTEAKPQVAPVPAPPPASKPDDVVGDVPQSSSGAPDLKAVLNQVVGGQVNSLRAFLQFARPYLKRPSLRIALAVPFISGLLSLGTCLGHFTAAPSPKPTIERRAPLPQALKHEPAPVEAKKEADEPLRLKAPELERPFTVQRSVPPPHATAEHKEENPSGQVQRNRSPRAESREAESRGAESREGVDSSSRATSSKASSKSPPPPKTEAPAQAPRQVVAAAPKKPNPPPVGQDVVEPEEKAQRMAEARKIYLEAFALMKKNPTVARAGFEKAMELAGPKEPLWTAAEKWVQQIDDAAKEPRR